MFNISRTVLAVALVLGSTATCLADSYSVIPGERDPNAVAQRTPQPESHTLPGVRMQARGRTRIIAAPALVVSPSYFDRASQTVHSGF